MRRENLERESVRAAVVVPAYQAAATLKPCLESLVNQRLPGWLRLEIVLVDDGSTDDTARIAGCYHDRGVRVIRTFRHGAAAARNTGVRHSSSDCHFIFFTDADCEAAPDWAERLATALCQAPASIAGIKGAYGTRQSSNVAKFSQLEFEERYRRFHQRSLQPDFADTYSAAYRRELLIEQPFDESLPGAIIEDAELGWRLRQAGYGFFFEPAAIVYHHHPARIGRYFWRKFRIAHWRVTLYRRYPGQLPADSHTSQGAKGQMVLLAAILGCLGLGLIGRLFGRPGRIVGNCAGLVGLAGLGALQLSFVKFLGRAVKMGGPRLALTAWLMLNLRVAAYSSGAGLGLLEMLWGKFLGNAKKSGSKKG